MALFSYTPPAYSGIHSLLDPEAEAKFRASFTFPQSLFDLTPSSDAIEPVIQVASADNNALLPLRRRRRLPVDEGGGDDNSNQDPPPKSLIRPYQVGMDYGFGGPPEIDPDAVYDLDGIRVGNEVIQNAGKALSDAEFFRLVEPVVNESPRPLAPPLTLSNETVLSGEELSEEEQRRLEEKEAVLPAPFTYPPTGGLLGKIGNYPLQALNKYMGEVSDIGRMNPWAGGARALMPFLAAAMPTALSLPFGLLTQFGEDSTPYEYTGKPVTDIMYGPNQMMWFGADVPGGGYYNRVQNGLLGPAGSRLTVHGPETKPGWFLGGDRQLIPATVRGVEDQIIDGRLVRGAGPDMAGRTYQYDFHGGDDTVFVDPQTHDYSKDHPLSGFAVGEDLPAQMDDLESLMNVDYEQGLWDDAY